MQMKDRYDAPDGMDDGMVGFNLFQMYQDGGRSFLDQNRWDKERRVVARIERHNGEFF
jgi:hypothetical protein